MGGVCPQTVILHSFLFFFAFCFLSFLSFSSLGLHDALGHEVRDLGKFFFFKGRKKKKRVFEMSVFFVLLFFSERESKRKEKKKKKKISSSLSHLRSQPRRQPQAQRVRHPEMRRVLRPQRLEVQRQTDRPPAVHLCGLPIQNRNPDFGSCRWISGRCLELERELVAEEVVDVPADA